MITQYVDNLDCALEFKNLLSLQVYNTLDRGALLGEDTAVFCPNWTRCRHLLSLT